MIDHRTRTFLIWALALVCLGGLIFLGSTGEGASELATRLETALALLIPAVLDAQVEQSKRSKTIVPPAPEGVDAEAD